MDAFRAWDHQGRGVMRADELSAMLSQIPEKLTRREIRRIVAEADKKKNGIIVFEGKPNNWFSKWSINNGIMYQYWTITPQSIYVGRCVGRYIDRHSVNMSTDSQSMCRPSVGVLSADINIHRHNDWVSTATRPTPRPILDRFESRSLMDRPSYLDLYNGRYRPTLGRHIDRRIVRGHLSKDTWSDNWDENAYSNCYSIALFSPSPFLPAPSPSAVVSARPNFPPSPRSALSEDGTVWD